MTNEEARAVTRVALEADHGCPYCVTRALRSLMRELPDVPWLDLAREIDPDIDMNPEQNP